MLSPDTFALSTESEGALRALGALIVVVLLILLSALFARKIGLDKYWGAAKNNTRRLQLVETLYLDPRTRVFIVRVDNQEHSVLHGTSGSVVLHSAPAREELPVKK